MPRTLPTLSDQHTTQGLATWKNTLKQVSVVPLAPAAPINFRAAQARGGIQLSWTPVPAPVPKGKIGTNTALPDGYVIQKSYDGTFVDDLTVIQIPGITQAEYFDSVGGNPKKVHYRIRATSGTNFSPQSTVGPLSGVLIQTSLDASDQATTPGTVSDQYTSDKVSATARLGEYAPNYASPAPVSSGTPGTPDSAVVAITFDQVGSGTNVGQALVIGGGSSLNPTSSGVINANEIVGARVNGTPGTGQILVSQSNGSLVWQDASSNTSIPTNDQSGVTAYTVPNSDQGTLTIFSDASPVAVSLIAASSTDGWYAFYVNLGAGLVTITPSSLIDGLASITLIQYAGVLIQFDGTNYHSVRGKAILPTTGPTTHQFVTAIASDGTGTLAQPAFTDISGTLAGSQLPTFTGDVTNSAAAMTVAAIRANVTKTDIVGQLTILATTTTISHTFSSSYTSQPIVIVTPLSDWTLAKAFWVTYSGGGPYTGFTININTSLAGNLTFNYFVLGNPS